MRMTITRRRGPSRATRPTGHRPARPTPARRLTTLVVAGLVAAGAVLFAPAVADAAEPSRTIVLAVVNSVDALLSNVRNWLMGILAALATVYLTVGGVRYITANGNPSDVEQAKSAFRSAGFGYALAALAPLVVTILKQIVGA